ncbi:pseudouridine-5'-phosphate glycosidase [Alkalicoccus chagannorensis]|uniref:pseudouridine-5'-phosphate glycosidase n=1 Tax=Alkalicoccus chagannorensis TaxID=427072 RepID=UPI00040ECA03|nr:pseudouridine-5'-phosphate glycosidase [Alkalicoccus chagannorensis]
MQAYVELKQEVEEALLAGRPVAALESTIISHGMPYPRNVATAKEVEQILRDEGVVPATIAVLDGKIKVGLTEEEIERLAVSDQVEKVSRRDLAHVIASKKEGATTVAATMICAELAGIRVFVTGGIGGVHRFAESTMDISADLEELASTDVAVVCAGAKSILDIEKTLEYLETKGVPVLGYQTSAFPAFYTPDSGFAAPLRIDEPEEAAAMMKTKWDLNLKGGIVIGNPVPEQAALDQSKVDRWIQEALKAAETQHISGKETTPFLLSSLYEKSGGATLETNIALVKHNAATGAAVAKAYARQRHGLA